MIGRGRAVVLAPALASRGGAERVAAAAASCLQSEGFQTVLAYPGNAIDLSELGAYFDLNLEGVEPMVLPHQARGFAGREEFRILSETIRWARRIAPLEPALLFNCQTGSEMPALARRNFYYVHFPHDITPRAAQRSRRAYLRASRAARSLAVNRGRPFLRGYEVLANSAFTAGHVRAQWERSAQVMHPPVPDLGPGAATRERWILSTGRFQPRIAGHPHKRQDAMIEAFGQLEQLHRDGWQLHLAGSVGSADEVARLEALANGLPVVIHPNAPHTRLVELYRRSSIYWHAQGFGEPAARPSAQEHFGMTVAEALSAGLVPLVYDTAGPAEIVAGLPGRPTWHTLDDLRAATKALARATPQEFEQLRAASTVASEQFTGEAFGRLLVRTMAKEQD